MNPSERPKNPNELIRDIKHLIDRLHKSEKMDLEAYRASVNELAKALGYQDHSIKLDAAFSPDDPTREYVNQHIDSMRTYALQIKAASDALVALANLCGDEQEELKAEIERLYKELIKL